MASALVAELLRLGCAYPSDEIAAIEPIARNVLPLPPVSYKRVATEPFCACDAQQFHSKLRVDLAQVQIS
jgi:hypothetical protein